MHCWKACYEDHKYKFLRRFFISAFVSLVVFIVSYIAMQAITARQFDDQYFIIFLITLILLYPAHKLFHIVPIIDYRKFMRWEFERHFYIIPAIELKVECPIPKKRFAFALILPFILINGVLFASIIAFPQYGHYITILLAYHNGISVFDILYFKSLFFSPKNALVEENNEGFEILVEDDVLK